MNMLRNRHCAAFAGSKLIASGGIEDVARATKNVLDANPATPVLIFDESSELVEIDFRGTPKDVLKRIRDAQAKDAGCDSAVNASPPAGSSSKISVVVSSNDRVDDAKPGPGRPKLGVVAREVTLLPRHWDWLSSQPGGASVTLRKLVDAARKQDDAPDRTRRTREVTYKFMSAMAGNETGFEEATRALFAGDPTRFDKLIQAWPADIRDHIRTLANHTP